MQSPNFNYIANDNQVTRHNMQQVVGLNVDFHAGCKKFTSFDDCWVTFQLQLPQYCFITLYMISSSLLEMFII